MNTAQALKLKDESELIASRSNNRYRTDLYYHRKDLMRHLKRGYFFAEVGGGAIYVNYQPDFVDESTALQWVEEEAIGVDGFGYTPEEASRVMAGEDVRGTREWDRD